MLPAAATARPPGDDGASPAPSGSAAATSSTSTSGKKRARPDVAERLKRRRTIDTKVVKMTLNTFCLNPDIKKELDSIALGLTRTAIETSRFLNL